MHDQQHVDLTDVFVLTGNMSAFSNLDLELKSNLRFSKKISGGAIKDAIIDYEIARSATTAFVGTLGSTFSSAVMFELLAPRGEEQEEDGDDDRDGAPTGAVACFSYDSPVFNYDGVSGRMRAKNTSPITDCQPKRNCVARCRLHKVVYDPDIYKREGRRGSLVAVDLSGDPVNGTTCE